MQTERNELGRNGLLAESKKCLVVDDDAPLRRNLLRSLEKEGFEVVAAASLREAYQAVGEFSPDYAILDLNLEDGHGMQLIDTLKELRPGCRILILTGYDSIASSVLALKSGAIGYLAKPVSAEQVIATLYGQTDTNEQPSITPMSADRVRWEHIQRVFEQCNRNVSETARRLNMHRRTLQRILSKRAPK